MNSFRNSSHCLAIPPLPFFSSSFVCAQAVVDGLLHEAGVVEFEEEVPVEEEDGEATMQKVASSPWPLGGHAHTCIVLVIKMTDTLAC